MIIHTEIPEDADLARWCYNQAGINNFTAGTAAEQARYCVDNNMTIVSGAVVTVSPNHFLVTGSQIENNTGTNGLIVESDHY